MTDQQHGLVFARSMQPHDHVLLPVVGTWAEHFNVAVGKSGIAKALCNRFGSRGHAAYRVCRINLDELFENVERQPSRSLILARRWLRLHRGRKQKTKKQTHPPFLISHVHPPKRLSQKALPHTEAES